MRGSAEHGELFLRQIDALEADGFETPLLLLGGVDDGERLLDPFGVHVPLYGEARPIFVGRALGAHTHSKPSCVRSG